MASELISKGDGRFGVGYGLFTYFDFPLRNENQSFRIELLDLAFFALKGENIFTTTEDAKGYISIKLGYKYVFSETQQGFYVEPSAGYCRVAYALVNSPDKDYGDGIAGAVESGYTLEVGQRGHTLNLGLKYEYDYGGTTHTIQSLGLRFSYGFGIFRKNKD